MVNRTVLAVHKRRVVVHSETESIREALNQLGRVLENIACDLHCNEQYPPMMVRIMANQCISVPQEHSFISAQSSPLKVLSAGNKIYIAYQKSVMEIDLQKGQAVGYFDESIFPYSRLVSHGFLLSTVVMLLHTQGLYFLHSAALERDGDGFLFIAPSGGGKSTNTLRLIEAGWNYLSDDTLLLENDENGSVVARAIPSEVKITPSGFRRESMRHLWQHSFTIPHNDDHFIKIRNIYPAQFRTQCTPATLIFPEISNSEQSELVAIPKLEAIAMLMNESPICHIRHSRSSDHLTTLKNLVNQSTAYKLCAGRDLLESETRLHNLLSELAPSKLSHAN